MRTYRTDKVMSKETLNLSIDKNIKQRARRIAKQRGVSISQLFEDAITREDDSEEFFPEPGSAAYRLMNLIPDSEKPDRFDYKKLKMEVLKKKYEL